MSVARYHIAIVANIIMSVARSVDGQVLAQVGESNRKDVRNAVDLAAKAQAGWAKRSPFNRQQILYYIAENLELRRNEFGSRLAELTGCASDEALDEVSLDKPDSFLDLLLILQTQQIYKY